MYCPKCHKAMDPEMPKCLYCGYLNKEYDYNKNRKFTVDSNNTLLNVIGILIPILGFILYFANKEKMPKMARSIRNYSVFGIMIYISIAILLKAFM